VGNAQLRGGPVLSLSKGLRVGSAPMKISIPKI
jgi:hypothetical protein